MALNLSVNVWHRCGTCGAMFQSVRELSSHVAITHSGVIAPGEDEAGYPASRPAGGTPLHARYTQFANHPMAQ